MLDISLNSLALRGDCISVECYSFFNKISFCLTLAHARSYLHTVKDTLSVEDPSPHLQDLPHPALLSLMKKSYYPLSKNKP